MKAECAMDTKIDILDFSEFVVRHDCPLYSDDDIQNFEEWKARHGRNSMSIEEYYRYPSCYKGVKANAPTHYTHDDRTDPSRMKNRVMITANASPSCKHRITADSEMKGYIRRDSGSKGAVARKTVNLIGYRWKPTNFVSEYFTSMMDERRRVFAYEYISTGVHQPRSQRRDGDQQW